jgi:hypothetical protein
MTESNAICLFVVPAVVLWRIAHLSPEENCGWNSMAWLPGRLGRSSSGRLMDYFYSLSLWLSLPLAIWLSSGWIGLIFHWHALLGAAWLFERAPQKEQPVFPPIVGGKENSEGDASCAVVSREGH